ncbi:fibromodulin [Electrophorus electricus]|uniref:fibromodulin n=1 Tax=Electrophorus electricus TaxID=8005 RepID=UPI0015D03529|nr:fibromodulin [Electrophorus electricus]
MCGWIVLLLWVGLVDLSVTQQTDALTWLNYLRNRANGGSYTQNHGNHYISAEAENELVEVECPLECDCPSTYPYAMYCHSRNLQHVPFVPSRMKYVYLQNNRIRGITDGVFDNATGLVWIILHMNQLCSDQISDKIFAKLPKLERLFLHHNQLERLPTGLPRSLRDLRANHNAISSVSATALRGLDRLAELRLHTNTIEDLGSALEPLQSLTILDLRGNRLTKVPENLPPRLSQLYLEHNLISMLPAGFLRERPELRFVRLAHNHLTDDGIPPDTFNVTTLLELDLSHNRLEKIPTMSTRLQNLYLQANRIKEFSVSSFCRVVDMANYSNLRVLRLEANKISPHDVSPKALLCLRKATTIYL